MVEAPLQEIENIKYDTRIPFSGPGGRRFKSSLPDQLILNQLLTLHENWNDHLAQ
jgi:hypothetical protein